MMEEYVMLKSYNDKLVKVPLDKRDEYIRNQRKIKDLLTEGKNLNEVLKIMREDNDK